MRNDYTLQRPSRGVAQDLRVYCNPSEAHRVEILELLDRDEHALQSMLDPEEVARVEHYEEEQETFIVFKRPVRRTEDPNQFISNSVGLYLFKDKLVVISADENLPAGIDRASRASSLREAMLILFFESTQEYQADLRAIKKRSQEIQIKINSALENHHLLEMLSLSESLIYQVDAIDSNSTLLAKVRNIAEKLQLTESELDLLDDVIVDNKQVSRQGHLYSTILAGMLDARGNIINNNMNVLLKNLTIINVIFLPLGVLASMGGMSEYSTALEKLGMPWWEGYVLFIASMGLLGIALWFLIMRWVNRPNKK